MDVELPTSTMEASMVAIHHSLSEILTDGSNKKGLLLSWISNNLKGKTSSEDAQVVFEEIRSFIKALAFFSAEEAAEYKSQQLTYQLSQLLLKKVKEVNESTAIVSDLATMLSYILLEELEHLTEEVSLKKQYRKQKPSNSYSVQKVYSVTMLSHLYQYYGDAFNSITPMVVSAIFKNIKKTLEKPKYYNANFLTCLMRFFDIISRSGSSKSIDENSYQKFSKLCRNVLSDIKNERTEYPADFLVSLLGALFGSCTRDSFTNVHFSSLLTHLENKIHPFLACFFKLHELRLFMGKTLAEILYFYSSEKGIEHRDVIVFYSKLFSNSSSRKDKVSVLQSLNEYVAFNRINNFDFLQGTMYLEIFEIFCSELVSQSSIDIFRYVEWFEKLHEFILPYIGDSSKNLLISKIFSRKDELLPTLNSDICTIYLNFLDKLFEDLSDSIRFDEGTLLLIKESLLNLCTCENYHIRILANQTMRQFLYHFPVLIGNIMVQILEVLTDQFELEKGFQFAKNHGLALLISSLLGIEKSDYVPYEVVMKVSFFATGVLKNNTLSTRDIMYEKQLLSWILLTGVISFNDQEFLKIQSSQLFIFWKNILTHSYRYHDDDDLLRNLELRNHSLACMLNFLKNVELDLEMARQIFYLISKCSNFNNSLDVTSELVGTCLVRNEQRTLQIYEIISPFVIKEFSTSLLLQMLKNFGSPGSFIWNSGRRPDNSIGSGTAEEVAGSFDELLESDEGGNLGLCSYVCTTDGRDLEVLDELDGYISNPVVRSVCFDYFSLLFKTDKPTDSFTSIVDSSIKLFSTSFPMLNPKIQFSVLETLNSYVSTKKMTHSKTVAAKANIIYALKIALDNAYNAKVVFEKSVGNLFLTVIDSCCIKEKELFLEAKTGCYGKICFAVDKNSEEHYASDLMKIAVKNIVDDENPYTRVFNLGITSEIYKFAPAGVNFREEFSVVIALINDPHPVVHYWALKSLRTILKKHNRIDILMFSELVELFQSILLNDDFGRYGPLTMSSNYSVRYDSHEILSESFSLVSELIGPDLFSCRSDVMESFLNVLQLLLLSSSPDIQMQGLNVASMLAVFKREDVLDMQLCLKIVKVIMFSHLQGGFQTTYFSVVFGKIYELGSYSRTNFSFNKCLNFLLEIGKLKKSGLFGDGEIENLLWLSLVFLPRHKLLKSVLEEWIEYTSTFDVKCLVKLLSLFNVSRDRVMGSGLNHGVSNENLMSEVLFSAEEEKSIVFSAGNHEKENHAGMETTSTDMKLFVVDLVIGYITRSDQSSISFKVAARSVSQLVKMSFTCICSSSVDLKLSGLKLLGLLVKKFGVVEDKEVDEKSILVEHEARISSALLAAFSKDSSATVVCCGLLVTANLVSAGIVPFQSLRRVCNITKQALLDFAEKKADITVGEFVIQNLRSRKKIEASVLYAWATLKMESHAGVDAILSEYLDENLEVLVPMWIIFLRDQALARYSNQHYGVSLDIGLEEVWTSRGTVIDGDYEHAWIKLVKAICFVNEQHPELISDYLSNDDMSGFVFVMFARLFECLVRYSDEAVVQVHVLEGLSSLLSFPEKMAAIYFNERVHPEILDVFNRLALMGSDEVKISVVTLLGKVISKFLNYCEDLSCSSKVDFVYDYIQVITKVLSLENPNMFEFSNSTIVAKVDVGEKIKSSRISGVCFDTLARIVPRFPLVLKSDLYSCCLYMAGKVLVSPSGVSTVSYALKLVKTILEDSEWNSVGRKNIILFIDCILDSVIDSLNVDHCIVSIMLFLQCGYDNFNLKDSKKVTENLFEGLQSPEFDEVCVQGIKRLMSKVNSSSFVANVVLELLLKLLNYEGGKIGARLIVEIFNLFYVEFKVDDVEGKFEKMLIFIKVMLNLYGKGGLDESDVGSKIEYLIDSDREIFKKCMDGKLLPKELEDVKKLLSNKIYGREVEGSLVELKLFE